MLTTSWQSSFSLLSQQTLDATTHGSIHFLHQISKKFSIWVCTKERYGFLLTENALVAALEYLQVSYSRLRSRMHCASNNSNKRRIWCLLPKWTKIESRVKQKETWRVEACRFRQFKNTDKLRSANAAI